MRHRKVVLHNLAGLVCALMLAPVVVGCAPSGGLSTAPAQSSSSQSSQVSSGSLQISPSSLSLAVAGTYTFTASGGYPPYTYYMLSGVGGVVEGTGYYTAGSVAGTAQMEVVDSRNNVSKAFITIGSSGTTTTTSNALAFTSSSVSVTEGSSYTFTATGGTGVYYYVLVSGNGSITTTGNYTASSTTTGTDQIAVIDSDGDVAYATITITAALSYAPVVVYEWEASSNDFTYSLTDTPITGYVYEGAAFQIYSSAIPNSEPLYLCTVATGGPFLSVSSSCEGQGSQTPTSTLGFIYTSAMAGFYPLYRFSSPNGQHFLETTEFALGAQFGFEYEGVLGYVESP